VSPLYAGYLCLFSIKAHFITTRPFKKASQHAVGSERLQFWLFGGIKTFNIDLFNRLLIHSFR